MITRKVRARIEAMLEDSVVDLLSGYGYLVRRQVHCAAGIADVVIGNADMIFELKAFLNRSALYKSLGQLWFYRPQLNPAARLGIICKQSSVPHLHEQVIKAGIWVYVYEDFKRMMLGDLLEPPNPILCDPPFAKPRRARGYAHRKLS